MLKIIVTCIVIVSFFTGNAQQDTLLKKRQKGFLFLSAYHYLYDYDGGHTRPLGFYDFFFPSQDFQDAFSSKNVLVFTGGIRIDFIIGRFGLKKSAVKMYGQDSSHCYKYDSFYVLPVIVDLKEFEDSHPIICRRNFYEIKTLEGKEMRFEYLHKAAFITTLIELPIKVKKQQTRTAVEIGFVQ